MGLDEFNAAVNNIPNVLTKSVRTTGEVKGRQLYNTINNKTRVKTGRLKRGNFMEISDTGFHYWNNVPYAGYMNTGFRGNRFMDEPYFDIKESIVAFLNTQIAEGIKDNFVSRGTTK